ncbi:hypothetical protein DS901_00275 [Loktanella sp. D2R18]|nr:hypothetical protein DS901_00275 [Loktanella sp. D2R18]
MDTLFKWLKFSYGQPICPAPAFQRLPKKIPE